MTGEKPDQEKYSDLEIFKLDQDRFGAQDYAGVLAKRAATADTPLTIGIYGRWGSGKTSLMRLVDEKLRVNLSSEQIAYQKRTVEQLPE